MNDDDRQQMLEEREAMALEALEECLEKGVSDEAIKIIKFEFGFLKGDKQCQKSAI